MLEAIAAKTDSGPCVTYVGPDGAGHFVNAIERCAIIHGHPVSPDRVLVVGDTPRDIEAAHAAGAIGVGLATGKYTLDALREAGADYVVATLEAPLPGVQNESIPHR